MEQIATTLMAVHEDSRRVHMVQHRRSKGEVWLFEDDEGMKTSTRREADLLCLFYYSIASVWL